MSHLDFYALGSMQLLEQHSEELRQWKIQSDKLIKIPKIVIWNFLLEQEMKRQMKKFEIYEDTNRKVQFW